MKRLMGLTLTIHNTLHNLVVKAKLEHSVQDCLHTTPIEGGPGILWTEEF